MQYKVTNAIKTKEIEGQYGKMAIYTLELEGEEPVELMQKPDTPAPKAGDILEGEISETQYGRRFKKARSFGGRSGGKGDYRTPEQIMRTTALELAYQRGIVKYRVGEGKFGDDDDPLKPSHIEKVAYHIFRVIKDGFSDTFPKSKAKKPLERAL